MAESLSTMLSRAFKWHWNLLFFGAGVVLSALSGHPDMLLPVVAAAELGYLGFLGTNSRFQNVLRGGSVPDKVEKERRQETQRKLEKLMQFLSEEDAQRFLNLRMRCAELLDLRRKLDAGSSSESLGSFRAESLDRMLWLFLKLLHQKSGLERFLGATRREKMQFELSEAQEQLEAAEKRTGNGGSDAASKLADTLRGKLETIQERIQNYDRAADAWQILCAEVDKTEQKITHICEVGMTGLDAGDLSIQIDSISDTLKHSESDFVQPQVRALLDDDTPPAFISTSGMVPQ